MPRLPRGGKSARIQAVNFRSGLVFSGMLQVRRQRNDSDKKMFRLFRTRRFQKKRGNNGQNPSGDKRRRGHKPAGHGGSGGGRNGRRSLCEIFRQQTSCFQERRFELDYGLGCQNVGSPAWSGKRHYDLGRIDKVKSAGWHKFRRSFGGAWPRRSAGTRFGGSQRKRRFADKNHNQNPAEDFQKSQRFD